MGEARRRGSRRDRMYQAIGRNKAEADRLERVRAGDTSAMTKDEIDRQNVRKAELLSMLLAERKFKQESRGNG